MFESFYYLIALGFALTGLAMLDHAYRLAFFWQRRATVIAVLSGMLIFLLWDVIGIVTGIFIKGDSPYLSGLVLGPEFPLEELLFLCLLSYNALLLWRGAEKLWPSRT